ncbi:MAG: glycosyltransferase family 2 protein [Chloroflexi bacterium]|nr:MAG: glycosyltransferase family 2 protein [Chloroflexota bacterium]
MVKLFSSSILLIVYTFFGYPALLALLARLRPRSVNSHSGFTPSVSLIIAAYNEADVIEAKLRNCFALDYPHDKLQIIVAADGSDDNTAELAQQEPHVTVLFQPERKGKMAAINRAVAEARGEILVFSDANNMYTPDTLRALLAPFADTTVGVVTGRKAIDDGKGRELDRAEGLYWRYESKIKQWESQIGSVTGVAGEILAVRRDAFQAPPVGTVNDDFVLAMLAAIDGWRVVYAPDAVSLEPASATLRDEATRRSRIVTGRYQALWQLLPAMLRKRPQLAWQVISHKGLRPVVPFAMLVTLLSNLALLRGAGWARWIGMLQGVFYGSALLGWRNEARGRRNRWLYLPYYFCRVNGASVQGLQRFLSRRNHALWAKAKRG